MIHGLIAMTLLTLAEPPPADVVKVTAQMPETAIAAGSELEFTVKVAIPEEWSAMAADRIRRGETKKLTPLLQIQTPASVTLTGEVLEDPKALSRNEFVRAPFEQMIIDGEAKVGLRVTGEPQADDAIEFNVLTYISRDVSKDGRLVRKRFRLPLEAGATATEISAEESDWGAGDVLQIGDKAPEFELPQANGEKVRLADFVGKSNVVITTYRAFW